MSTIKELREQQARIATNARAKNDEIKDDTPEERAAEIEREFDAMMAEHDKIGKAIERQSRLDAAERALESGADPRRPGITSTASGAGSDGEIGYRQAFHAYLRAGGALGDMDPEARSVLRRGYSQVEHRAQTTGDAAGGYTVPTELATILVQTMVAWGPMYDPGISTELVTSSGNQITMPTVNDAATAVVKHTEGTTLTDDGGSDVVFGQKVLDAYPFNTEWLRLSLELMNDSVFNVEALIGSLLGERLGRRANQELTVGDGVGDPNGVVTASSLGKTAVGTAAFTGDELIDLLHSVDPAYRASPRFRWMFNDITLAAIRKLKDGDGNYLWQMGDVRQGEPDRLLGKPFSVNPSMASPATGTKPIIVGDFSKYFVRKVGSPLVGAITDKDFWPGIGMAGYIRFDGELADPTAIKHLIMA